MERSEDYKMWKALLRQAGVREARLHDARHTAGTLLVEQGVHIRVVQEILGHARVTTTERYTHIASPQVKDASERMGAALWARTESNCNRNCNLRPCGDQKAPLVGEDERGSELRRLGDLNPGWA
ncbi:hypothetical protein GCM10023074_27450 [Microbispora amethystogenes]|uniref:Tyr recombinase domain-containing protein n=2 Tax=Microbispora amethystogenes TaxID=1427754 RepID=A0ABQ4F9N1_9ACTN|nr:hypothetical protein Mam01_16920 [Microbispora amethystogenes]